ncbi:hypothetical protein KIPB_001678 [Kipferlia bialata]|uniref:Sm domain-containing protein n=1 Tax=Kipferlia bialata TaxID=797122 RepID=A0A9K3GFB6_9EUKA|nr:hypothetical protein KIPB_001678 [Kipferlia bialata]|eukprot:g1678.t1
MADSDMVGQIQAPLDLLREALDGTVVVSCHGHRELTGRLHAFDQHCNLLIGDARETHLRITIDTATMEETQEWFVVYVALSNPASILTPTLPIPLMSHIAIMADLDVTGVQEGVWLAGQVPKLTEQAAPTDTEDRYAQDRAAVLSATSKGGKALVERELFLRNRGTGSRVVQNRPKPVYNGHIPLLPDDVSDLSSDSEEEPTPGSLRTQTRYRMSERKRQRNVAFMRGVSRKRRTVTQETATIVEPKFASTLPRSPAFSIGLRRTLDTSPHGSRAGSRPGSRSRSRGGGSPTRRRPSTAGARGKRGGRESGSEMTRGDTPDIPSRPETAPANEGRDTGDADTVTDADHALSRAAQLVGSGSLTPPEDMAGGAVSMGGGRERQRPRTGTPASRARPASAAAAPTKTPRPESAAERRARLRPPSNRDASRFGISTSFGRDSPKGKKPKQGAKRPQSSLAVMSGIGVSGRLSGGGGGMTQRPASSMSKQRERGREREGQKEGGRGSALGTDLGAYLQGYRQRSASACRASREAEAERKERQNVFPTRPSSGYGMARILAAVHSARTGGDRPKNRQPLGVRPATAEGVREVERERERETKARPSTASQRGRQRKTLTYTQDGRLVDNRPGTAAPILRGGERKGPSTSTSVHSAKGRRGVALARERVGSAAARRRPLSTPRTSGAATTAMDTKTSCTKGSRGAVSASRGGSLARGENARPATAASTKRPPLPGIKGTKGSKAAKAAKGEDTGKRRAPPADGWAVREALVQEFLSDQSMPPAEVRHFTQTMFQMAGTVRLAPRPKSKKPQGMASQTAREAMVYDRNGGIPSSFVVPPASRGGVRDDPSADRDKGKTELMAWDKTHVSTRYAGTFRVSSATASRLDMEDLRGTDVGPKDTRSAEDYLGKNVAVPSLGPPSGYKGRNTSVRGVNASRQGGRATPSIIDASVVPSITRRPAIYLQQVYQ